MRDGKHRNFRMANSVDLDDHFVAHDIAKQIKGKKQKLLFITTAVEVVKGDLQWFRNDRKSFPSVITINDISWPYKHSSIIIFSPDPSKILSIISGLGNSCGL